MSVRKRLPRSAPEVQGVASSAILAFVQAVEEQISEVHSFMLLRRGAVIAEAWWSPYGPEIPHMLFSLSKSFTSTAVGLAVAEGRLSVDDAVLSFFPEDAPARVSKNLAAMRIRHLLSMCTGHADDTMGYLHRRRDGNWIRAFLARPVKYAPGTHFLYNTGATYMLSAIIQKVTGLTLLEYLRPRLFDPLGIANPEWELSPQGISTGGYGLSITTEDIARFGQLYLQKGRWGGKRLLPAAWVEAATAHQIANESPNADWRQGYGYQFWRCQHNVYRGDGAFGQYCIVMPEQEAVLAITSGLGDMQLLLDLVWQHLLPALSLSASLPTDARAHQTLTSRLESLACLPPIGNAASPTAARLSGKMFRLEPNALRITGIAFDFAQPGAALTIRTRRGSQRLVCGAGAWQHGQLALFPHSPHVAASGVWQDDDTFVITLRFFETPFVYTLTCRFAGEQLAIDGTVNVSFEPTAYRLTGRMQPAT